MANNRFIIHNDEDLRDGIKEWFCSFKTENESVVFFEFEIMEGSKIERFSANGYNNLLIVICALKTKAPNIRIYIQLIPNNIVNLINTDTEINNIKDDIKKLLIFFESLNLIDMLLKLEVIIRPSNEVLNKLIFKLNAKKEERKYTYSSKILCLNPLINDSEEQYNLTYRMKTLMNILYRHMKDKIGFKEVEEASGQIMFELVKNIYQHSGVKNKLNINGFTCAQINHFPIIKYFEENKEKNYTEAVFLSLSQKDNKYYSRGSFVSITVNDFGVGIHDRVIKKTRSSSISDAILYAFTTNFSSKVFENEDEYWKYDLKSKGIKLEHKGYGLLYCLLFVAQNLGRIKICSGNIELKLFTKIDFWAGGDIINCDTPVEFLNLLDADNKSYKRIFDIEIKQLNSGNFVGTQILIEIPIDNIYCRG